MGNGTIKARLAQEALPIWNENILENHFYKIISNQKHVNFFFFFTGKHISFHC